MSRSRKQSSYVAWTCCESEKEDKRIANRRLRSRNNQFARLATDDVPQIMMREISSKWHWGKDGKYRFNAQDKPEYLRK